MGNATDKGRLARIFCSHSSTEMVREERESGHVVNTITVSHICLRCGKDLM